MTNKNGFYSMHDEVLAEFTNTAPANMDAVVKIIKEVMV